MQEVYFISGLGANEHAFMNLQLPGIKQIHLKWFQPLVKETMESYAKRMSEKITTKDPIIVGLSLGGMVAIEIAKIIPVKKTILISSCKTAKEVPWYFKIGRVLPAHKLIPVSWIAGSYGPIVWFLGAITDEQLDRLKKVIDKSLFYRFDKWAMDAIVKWKNNIIPPNVIHIHGNKDKMLPYKFVKADHTIDGGTHLMVLTKGKKVSEILLHELRNELH
jgi:pimeloyl-ACP methyl ester carboxylesterase